MHFTHKNRGTCSTKVEFDMGEDHIIRNVSYQNGCSGNLQGISKLAEGMKAEDYIERCKNIKCGAKPTSCPAQLSEALEEAILQI